MGGLFTYGLPSSRGGVYLRCFWCLPPVVSPTLGGSTFEYTSGGSCGRACIIPPKNLDIYLRCYRHLPAVLKRAYPAGDVYLRWLLHRAWQDACHIENYLRCYRLHGGCEFEYTSGGSCGCACNTRPRFWDIYLRWGRDVYLRCFWCLPPVVSPTLGESKFEYTSGGSCGRASNVPPID